MSADELEASRARLASAGRDELRRIERALHDGVQQDLIALSVRLQLLQQAVREDPAAALDLVDELRQEAREALDRVRALANRVYPSLLEVRGLPDALRAVGARVDAETLGRYPRDIEAAAFFCCRALLDVAGANADTTIRLHDGGESLQVELETAGDPELTVARDLAEASGGVLVAETSSDGGTRVAATIPLR